MAELFTVDTTNIYEYTYGVSSSNPWYIEEYDFIGDTVGYFNANTNYFAFALDALQKTLRKNLRQVKAGYGIVLDPSYGTGNTVTISLSPITQTVYVTISTINDVEIYNKKTTAPYWHLGTDNNLLLSSVGNNRISQQIALSGQLVRYLQKVKTANAGISAVMGKTSITISSTLQQWYGGEGQIQLLDGRVLLFASHGPTTTNTNFHIYDPFTDQIKAISTAGLETWTHPISKKVEVPAGDGGGCLLSDGRVFICADTKTPQIFDPSTETFTSAGGDWNDFNTYNATLLPDGKVYVNPDGIHTRSLTLSAKIYDPITNTTKNSSNAVTSYAPTCVALRDGRVLRIPCDRSINVAQIYDWRTNSFTNTSLIDPQGAKGGWYTGRLTIEGNVVCAPSLSGTRGPAIYDPYNNAWKIGKVNDWYIPPKDQSNIINYCGGVLLPDGNLFFVPSNAGNGVIYNPYTDTTKKAISNPSNDSKKPNEPALNRYASVSLCATGDILIGGWVNTESYLLRFPFKKHFEPTVISSPFFNHGSY